MLRMYTTALGRTSLLSLVSLFVNINSLLLSRLTPSSNIHKIDQVRAVIVIPDVRSELESAIKYLKVNTV